LHPHRLGRLQIGQGRRPTGFAAEQPVQRPVSDAVGVALGSIFGVPDDQGRSIGRAHR